MEIRIDDERNGKTVLEILKKELRLSSKMITALKGKDNGIRVNGEHVTVRKILTEGDTLTLETEDTDENKNLIPTEMPLDIVFEDDDIILINKPPMMPTHPSHGHFEDTLANGVCHHVTRNRKEPFIFRSVNRLDRNTSGLVLIAKNRICASRLYESMQKGLIEKKYIAILDGRLNETAGTVDTFIRRQKESIITREICSDLPDASRAITKYRVISSSERFCAVEAIPITGRTHQLRLHFAYLGAPILGDDLYGKESSDISRQALHAMSLSFPHPQTGEMLSFSARMPEDMNRVKEKNNLKI